MGAKIKLTVESNFAEASKEIKHFGDVTEKETKSIEKALKKFRSEDVDIFIRKQKRAGAAALATGGRMKGLERTAYGLKRRMETLIRNGMDPQDKMLKKLRHEYSTVTTEIDRMTKAEKRQAAQEKRFLELKKKTLSTLKGLSVVIATSTVAGVVALTKLIDNTSKYADEVGKSAQRMGVSIGYYQKMESAAKHAGTGVATMNTAMRTLVKNSLSAKMGLKRQIDLFEMLGVSVKNSSGELKDQETLFTESLKAMAGMANQTERNALAQELLGRSATSLIPLFDEGAAAIDRYITSNNSAVLVSKEMAKQGQVYNDTIQTMGEELKKAALDGFSPVLASMLELLKYTKDSGAWDGIISGVKSLSVVLGKAGTLLTETIIGWEWLLSGKDKTQKTMAAYNELNKTFADTTKIMKQMSAQGYATITIMGRQIKLIKGVKDFQMVSYLEGVTNKIKAKAKASGMENTQIEKYIENLKRQLGLEYDIEKATTKKVNAVVAKKKSGGAAGTAGGVATKEGGWSNFNIDNGAVSSKLASISNVADAEIVAMQRVMEVEASIDLKKQFYFEQEKKRHEAKQMLIKDSISLTSNMFQNLQQAAENWGKKSRSLAIVNKGLAMAEAGIKTRLAFTDTLANAKGGAFSKILQAGLVLGSGLAQQVKIASTPIPSAETGGTFEVPRSNINRSDGQLMRVNQGEQVSVTPRGETTSQTTIVQINDEVLWESTQRGLDSGRIVFSGNNLQGAW